MIDKEILDAVLPLPTLDELKEQKVEELKDEGFVISNFHSGGVFYTMLMIVLRIKVEVIELLRVVLNNMFVSHAGGAWLDLKMADYSKKRKKAQKTQGFITVRRADMTGEAVKIPKGHVFKSILDINHAIRSGYSGATNAAVSEPEADVKLGKDKVITLGDVSVTVERE